MRNGTLWYRLHWWRCSVHLEWILQSAECLPSAQPCKKRNSSLASVMWHQFHVHIIIGMIICMGYAGSCDHVIVTWLSPCGTLLEVIKQTLGHQRVLIEVDQVRCLCRVKGQRCKSDAGTCKKCKKYPMYFCYYLFRLKDPKGLSLVIMKRYAHLSECGFPEDQ